MTEEKTAQGRGLGGHRTGEEPALEATLAPEGAPGVAGGGSEATLAALVAAARPGEDATLLASPSGVANAPAPVVQRGRGPGPSAAPGGAAFGEEVADLGELVTVSREHYSGGREFARGGMGRVLAARDRRLGRPVAIKELIAPRPDLQRRFEREARITGRLQHPSIVPIYEHGRWPSGEPFYAMKRITGRPLSGLVAEARTAADRLALLPRVTAVAEAIAYAHSQRVIHRDLKPGNVLVGDYGETVVIDWGLAKELDGPEEEVAEAGGEGAQAASGLAPGGLAPGGLAPGAGAPGVGALDSEDLAVTRRERPAARGAFTGEDRVPAMRGQGDGAPGSDSALPSSSSTGASGASGASSSNISSASGSAGGSSPSGSGNGASVRPSRATTRRPSGGGEGLTVAGAVMGTPSYMPPEQARGEPVDERADVYALGAILYNCLSGQHPYGGQSSEQVLAALAVGPPRPLRELQPDLPPDLLSIVEKAMAPEPAARYPSAEELAADLRRFQQGQLVGAHRYGGAALFLRWVRRNRVTVGITAGFLVALAVLGGASLLRIVEERDRAEAQRARAERASAEARRRAVEARENAQAATARLATFFADEGRRELLAAHPQRALAYLGEARRLGQRGIASRLLLGLATRQVSPQRAAVEAHQAPIEAVAFGGEGRVLYTASLDRVLRRWSVPELRLERSLALAGYPLRFSPDGTELLIGQRDQPSLALVEVATGKQRCVLRGEGQGAYLQVAWSEDGRRVAGHASGGAALVWDLPSCALAGRIPVAAATGAAEGGLGEPTRVLAGALGRDGRLLALPTEKHRVEVREVASGRLVSVTASAHATRIRALGLAPGGELLVTGSEDGVLKAWETATGRERASLPAHSRGVTAVAFSPDGQRFASAGVEGLVRLVQAGSGLPLATLKGHVNGVKQLRFSAEGAHLLSVGDDLTLRLWDGRQGALRATYQGHLDHITDAVFHPSGRWVASVGHDNRVRLWDATGPVERHTLGRDVALAVLDPSGRRILLALGSGALELASAQPGGVVTPLAGSGAPVTAAGLDPRGRLAAVAREGEGIDVWDLERSARRQLLKGHQERVTSLAFDPRGRYLATASWDETARLWDLASGKLHRVLGGHHGEVLHVGFDDGGARLVTVCADGLVRIWEPVEGNLLTTVGVTGSKLVSAGFFPGGARLLTVSEGLQILTWDVDTGTMRSSVEGQGRPFSQAEFAAGGALLLTSDRGRGAVWDAARGKLLLELDEGGAASMSQDGARVVTVDPVLRVATVRSLPVLAVADQALRGLLARVPWRLRDRRLVKVAEAPDWLRFPMRQAPPPGAPLLVDAALGLRILHRQGWSVTLTAGRYGFEKRIGPRARILVELFQGKTLSAVEQEMLAETVRERELQLKFGVASRWGTFAGLPAVVLRGPQFTQEASTRWVAVVPRDRPLVFTLALEGVSLDSPEGSALVAELEGAIRFDLPWADQDVARRAELVFALGEPRIRLGAGWRLDRWGPGAALGFEGPGGVKAALRALGPEGEGSVWCARGARFVQPTPAEVGGVPALRYQCPEDPEDQVFYVFVRRGYMLYLGLTDPGTRALSGPVTEFLTFLHFATSPLQP